MADKMEEWEEMDKDVKEQMENLFTGGNLNDLVVRKRDKMVVPR